MAVPATTSTYSSDVGELVTSLSLITMQDGASQAIVSNFPEKATNSFQPMRIYTRLQILFLSKSPLVKPPPNMPELKDWFGDNDLNLSKRESETVTPSGTRERRFRRDTEDGETSSRSGFRPTLSQPSQMGNFKHHSLRPGDRERDRERDDRERDIRDREGQDRLRHLSDKYDRDRLSLPSANPRSKERDVTPHFPPSSTSRSSAQAQITSTAARRVETREIAKKKTGEASEDWRRGGESRSTRDERLNGNRRERDERERPRSRIRESSRSRRNPSTSRRERDEQRRDRDRDLERDNDEDPRRWRDDGKRDERMAARRGERHSEQFRERERVRDKDSAWDTASERRWVPAEERDGRSKRSAGREKKATLGVDDGKERDDHRDRERDREKEPAWMDTYIPTSLTTGILGGKSSEGELDSIQVWKKEQKEKELKYQGSLLTSKPDEVDTPESVKTSADNKDLDEIQLFRLMMKREEEKKKGDYSPPVGVLTNDNGVPLMVTSSTDHPSTSPSTQSNTSHYQVSQPPGALAQPDARPPSIGTPHSLLPIHGSKEPTSLTSLSTSLEASQDGSRLPPPSRASNPPVQPENSSLISQNIERPTTDPILSQFNPPQGSRLLAFARTPSAAASQVTDTNQGMVHNGLFQNRGMSPEPTQQQIFSKPETLRSLPGFSPFEDQRPSLGFDGQREVISDIYRLGAAERSSSVPSIEHGSLQDVTSSLDNGAGYHAGKGSRFAKFFDGKMKEGGAPNIKPLTSGNITSPSPGPGGPRQEHSGFNGILGGSPDPRAMDEIYVMLNSSRQATRGTPPQIPTLAPASNNGSFGLQTQNHLHLLHQHLHQQQQQQIHSNRLEPLYESRLDDRNFVPDGLVPGLRSAPRARENNSMFSEVLDENMHFGPQRISGQRTLEQVYSSVPPSLYPQQVIRNGGIQLQQSQYRGGPSPISNQHSLLQSPQQQRLPPGLANLGGRPPHEPSQFLPIPGMPSPGLHGALHINGSQQPFNNFPPGSNPGYGVPQLRAPHQLQNSGGHHPVGQLNNVDLRGSNQNQFLGLSSVGGLRGTGGGFPSQQGHAAHMPGSLLSMRQQQQQQQQQLPPHMMPHILPHMQQHAVSGATNQPAQDLMALLMGGSHRE